MNKSTRDANGRFAPKVSRKIFSSDIYNVAVEDLSNDLDICNKCLKHSEESTLAVMREAKEVIQKSNADLRHSQDEHQKDIVRLRELNQKYEATVTSLNLRTAERDFAKEACRKAEKKWIEENKSRLYFEGIWHSAASDRDDYFKLNAKLKKDIRMRAAMFGTIGLLIGIIVEALIKLLS